MHSKILSLLTFLPLALAAPVTDLYANASAIDVNDLTDATPRVRGVPTKVGVQGVGKALWDDLVYYTSLSAASYYRHNCPKPYGVPKVHTFAKNDQDTDGYIAVDEGRKDIIVVIRGSSSIKNFMTDGNQLLKPFTGDDFNCGGCKCHNGYMIGWQAVAPEVKSQLKILTKKYPDYRITMTGHSLGASEVAIGSGQVAAWYPGKVWLWTQGEPRSGDKKFAQWIDKVVGPQKTYRGTHMNDGIPQVDGPILGYAHHSTEYWGTDPPSAANVKNCGEDNVNDCNGKAGKGHSLNAAHLKYFGVGIGVAELNTNVRCS